MTVKVTMANNSSDSVDFINATGTTLAQVKAADGGSSNGSLALHTTSAGTSSEKVRVDKDGNVGIGTSSPLGKLQLSGATPGLTSGYSQLNIFSTDAIGADKGGRISFGGVSGAGGFDPYGFCAIAGLKDNSTASNFSGYLTFSTATSGGTVTERARIDSSGNLLLNGTTSRASTGGMTITNDGTNLYLGPKNYGAGQEGGEILFGRGTDGAGAWAFDVLTGASPNIRLINASATGVQVVNGATSWSSYSDIRLKTNITPLRSVVQDIQSIECINYHLDGIDTEETPIRIGVSAQSLVGKFDEVLDQTEVKDKEGLFYSVRYSDMVPYLVKAIQEQQAQISDQQALIQTLTSRIEALENK